MRIALIVLLSLAIMAGCDIEQTKKGSLPAVDVDIETSKAKLPKFDVDWASVDVSTRTETVKIPKVVVVMEEVEVEVPYVDFDMPGDGEKEERTIQVEAEVSGEMQKLDIMEVYAANNRLYVVSQLKPTGQKLQDKVVRVSDRMVINVNDDLEVKHYIIGERPKGDFNRSFKYISGRDKIASRLKDGKQIFKKQ